MQGLARWLLRGAPIAALSALAVSGSGLISGVAAAQSGPVSPTPAAGTPALGTTGSTEQIRQLVSCGGTMFAVGTFTSISGSNGTFTRNNIFSFSATAPYAVTSWQPSVNGTVNSIQLTSDCSHAFIGGVFSQVDGSSAHNIAYIRTYNNTMVQDWAHSANGQVDTILRTPNNHLLVGGKFTAINGSSKKYYVSLNLNTGQDDGYLNLNISGHYVYTGVGVNTTEVYNQQLSPNGKDVLVEGTFTSVGGVARQQIFMLGVAGTATAWNSPEFSQFCADKHPFYIKSAAWSADGNEVYIADTGFAPFNWNKTFPLTGLCDAVAAFPATLGTVSHDWVNYTGCDSLYSVAADSTTVYVGGHERWANNATGCNNPGNGGIPAPGMGGFTVGASGGTLVKNSSGTAGLYSRDRGLGADQIYRTSAGIWIASDNLAGSNMCGGVSGHAGICFLPYS